MFVISDTASIQGFTFIVPSVSYGNVGQLAVDLLICETQAVKIGYAWHPAVFTVVGANPYEDSSSEIATGIEVYCSVKDKLAFLQIRGPLIKELCLNFLQELIQEMKKHNIGCVYILSGADDIEKRDREIQHVSVKCIVSPAFAAREKTYQSSSEEDTTGDVQISESISDNIGYKVIGCGFAKPLYTLCVENKLPAAVLIKHCSEGYNIPDAVAVVECLNKWIHVIPDTGKLKFVSSWRYMFGRVAEKSIF